MSPNLKALAHGKAISGGNCSRLYKPFGIKDDFYLGLHLRV